MLADHKYSTLGASWNKINVQKMFYCRNLVQWVTKLMQSKGPFLREKDPKLLLMIVSWK